MRNDYNLTTNGVTDLDRAAGLSKMKSPQLKTAVTEAPAASCYKIITGVEITALETKVNESLADGFLPVGNVSLCGNLLVQGVLKQAK